MLPRAAISFAVMGDLTIIDASQMRPTRYDDPEYEAPECIFVIGNNPLKSNGDGFLGHWIVELMQRGSNLIVCDPQLTWLASRADTWLQIRPGTDTALILSMIRTIIEEELYDRDFVDKWCYGFDELKEAVKDWTPEQAAKVTWIPAEKIVEATFAFAKASPACIQWGVATDMNVNGIQQAQAIICLNAICGNIEKPGGNIVSRDAYGLVLSYPYGYERYISAEMQAKRIGLDFSPLHRFAGGAATAHGDSLLQTIETDKPYPIKMLWFQSTNPIANMAGEAPRVYDAITKTDFNVVVDVFMTPTAIACADLVLPCAMSSERNSIRGWWTPQRAITKVSSYYEAKSDEEIAVAVCSRLNPDNFKPRTDIELLQEAMETAIEKIPYRYTELTEKVQSWPEHVYFRHEKGLLRDDGQPGFNTPTGRIELFSLVLQALGDPPLPFYEEPRESPYSTPELSKEYPLVLTTGHRSYEFFHSEHRQQPTMREFHPWPLVDIHPDTAVKNNIENGDWIWIENTRGRCKQIAHVTETMDPRVVNAEHGWWFPEEEGAEPSLFGVFNSNINNLTNQCQTGPTGYGAPYKSQICRIYKVTDENNSPTPGEQVTQLGGFKYNRKQYSDKDIHVDLDEGTLGGLRYDY
jgi:anaerobic selenocysteine-containing dehydrogenase